MPHRGPGFRCPTGALVPARSLPRSPASGSLTPCRARVPFRRAHTSWELCSRRVHAPTRAFVATRALTPAGLGCPSSALAPHRGSASGPLTLHRGSAPGKLTTREARGPSRHARPTAALLLARSRPTGTLPGGTLKPYRSPASSAPRPTGAPCRCRRPHARRAPAVPARSRLAGPLCRFRRVLPGPPRPAGRAVGVPRPAPAGRAVAPGGPCQRCGGGRSGIEKHRRGRPPRLSVARGAGGRGPLLGPAGSPAVGASPPAGLPHHRRRPDRAGERRRGPRRRTRPTDGEPGPWSRAPTRASRADTSPTATT